MGDVAYLRRVRLPGFSLAPVAGTVQQFIMSLPKGQTYYDLELRCQDAGGFRTQAEMVADIGVIKLRICGRTKWELSAAQLKKLVLDYYNQLPNGSAYTKDLGILRIPLCPDHLLDPNLSAEMGLGMADIPEGQAILEVNTLVASGITQLDVFGTVGRDSHAGQIRCVRARTATRSATGWEDDQVQVPADTTLIALHHTLGSAPGVVDVADGIDFVLNGVSCYQQSDDEMRQSLALAGRLCDATYVHFDFCRRNLIQDAIVGAGRKAILDAKGNEVWPELAPVANATRRTKWSTAPATYTVVVETVEPALADR